MTTERSWRFAQDGIQYLGNLSWAFPNEAVLAPARDRATLGQALFLSEAEFIAQENRFGTNPRPGRNLSETVTTDFLDLRIAAALTSVLGSSQHVMMKKFVMGVPDSWLPEYVRKEIEAVPAANLGAFVRPEFRDMTYFRGIDYHQDIIDYPESIADMVTVYLYLDDVTENDAPLRVLPGSHEFGATRFPHDLKESELPEGEEPSHVTFEYRAPLTVWSYRWNNYKQHILTGAKGDVYFWHSCLLHGTAPVVGDRARVSLRYIIRRNQTDMDVVNSKVLGYLSLRKTREDLDDKHVPVVRGNVIQGKGSD